jgi:hypothetical protein
MLWESLLYHGSAKKQEKTGKKNHQRGPTVNELSKNGELSSRSIGRIYFYHSLGVKPFGGFTGLSVVKLRIPPVMVRRLGG